MILSVLVVGKSEILEHCMAMPRTKRIPHTHFKCGLCGHGRIVPKRGYRCKACRAKVVAVNDDLGGKAL